MKTRLHNTDDVSEGTFAFAADIEGQYDFCFIDSPRPGFPRTWLYLIILIGALLTQFGFCSQLESPTSCFVVLHRATRQQEERWR